MFILVVLTLSFFWQTLAFGALPNKIGIMTFNVENLFDTKHDAEKHDYTFLPLREKKNSKQVKAYCETLKNPKWKNECLYLDWSQTNLSMKMKNLAAAILQVNDGHGPDVLILQEVENKNVLQELVDKHLQKAGYTNVILIEGHDTRGIDPAIVTRLPVVGEPILHEIPFANISEQERLDTRGILEATLELPDHQKLIVYSNHFPAPFHKRKYRIQAYQYLHSLLKEKGADVLQIAGGDFNTPSDEDKKFHLLADYVQSDWIITHQVSYHGDQGSEYYPTKKSWSFLDMILLSKNFNDQKDWEWMPDSFQIANHAKGQLDENGFPQSFDTHTKQGVSDHLPLYLEIQKN